MRSQGHTEPRSVPRSRSANGRRAHLASLDASLTVIAADVGFLRQFGGTAAEICGRSICDLLRLNASPALDEHFNRLLDGRSSRFTERVVGLCGPHAGFSAGLTGIAVHTEATSVACAVLLRPDDGSPLPHADGVPHQEREALLPLGARILEGVAGGASTEQLASRLYLSRQGVEYHVGQMLRQLEVPNRAALVARAHSKGMFAPGVWPPRILPGSVKQFRRRVPATASQGPFCP
ncbi:response regulator transcription factor [Streptomyces bathyalis]|uniref:response regulator transcription factor n=1 Tax=Streptomyces bathyalis TaxID=2710756 RepID=UPI001FECC8FD|nr:LuxR C-terminal-related transcriptional regulator [Streptomyces bathyalis]